MRHLAAERAVVAELGHLVGARPAELTDRVGALLARLKEAERELAAARQEKALAGAADLVQGARDLAGVTFVGHDAQGVAADDLRGLVLDVRQRLGADRPAVVAVASAAGGRPVVVVATNEPARAAGIRAGALVRLAAAALGGGGGGKDDLAQGGGSDPSAVPAALGAVENALRERG